jgi:hypothetical protein
MGWILFLLWIILSKIFKDYFWQVTIAVVGFYFILKLILGIVTNFIEQRAENKKYQGLLKEIMPKVQNVNLEPYQKYLIDLETLYETYYSSQKVVLKDKKGNMINICPKCNGYMKIVRWWRGPFLGCSNYPKCRSTRDYSEIFNMEI